MHFLLLLRCNVKSRDSKKGFALKKKNAGEKGTFLKKLNIHDIQ